MLSVMVCRAFRFQTRSFLPVHPSSLLVTCSNVVPTDLNPHPQAFEHVSDAYMLQDALPSAQPAANSDLRADLSLIQCI